MNTVDTRLQERQQVVTLNTCKRVRPPQVGIPTRSRLYSMHPIGIGTALVESLTSYLHRLAWTYRISPRTLATQEILPSFRKQQYLQTTRNTVNAFFRSWATSVNGTGDQVLDWVEALEQLTMRSDLRYLTVRAFTDGLPSRGLPRGTPAWCPGCYQQWRKDGQVLYQPLLWTLQIMTICPQHKRQLEERCPFCLKHQSALAKKTPVGDCTQCGMWLGTADEVEPAEKIADDVLIWQQWVLDAVEAMHYKAVTDGPLHWERLTVGLALCVEAIGTKRGIGHLTHIHPESLTNWISGRTTPSFRKWLDLCYTLDITPLQLITLDESTMQDVLHSKIGVYRQPQPTASFKHVDRERAMKLIQAVLDGREKPLGVRQIERRLGLGHRTLVQCFPKECALLVIQYKSYSKQRAKNRVAQVCEEVRTATTSLHKQGTYPGSDQVKGLLSNPNMMRTADALTTWHSVLRELGLEEATE